MGRYDSQMRRWVTKSFKWNGPLCRTAFLNKLFYRKPIEELKVTVGSLSLITPDPEEQIITILNIVKFDQYEATTQKHDIALIEVYQSIVLDKQTKCF